MHLTKRWSERLKWNPSPFRSYAVRATIQPLQEITVSTFESDPQITLFSTLVLSGVVFLFASFGISGWMRSRGLGIATTSVSLVGALAAFAALRPFCIPDKHA